MTNETIGHFALHPGNNTVGWNKDKGFFGDIQTKAKQIKVQPSELDLRIRKEVLDAVERIWNEMERTIQGQPLDILEDMKIIKDRLNLLWGE